MNKLLLIIFITSFAFSQNKEPLKDEEGRFLYLSNLALKDKESAFKYLENVLCNNGLSIYSLDMKTKLPHEEDHEDFFSLKIYKNIFHYKSKNTFITSNGKTILSANKNFEELEIYSLTQKEQKECFLSKFLKDFEIQNIIETIEDEDIIKQRQISILGEEKKIGFKVKIIISGLKISEEPPVMKIRKINTDNNLYIVSDYAGDGEFFMVQQYGNKSWNEKDNNINITYLDSTQNELIDFYKKENWEIIDFR